MAYCKNKMNEKWYEFNDSRCSEIRENDVLNVEPYLLFYSKTKSQDHFDRNIKVLQTIENQFQVLFLFLFLFLLFCSLKLCSYEQNFKKYFCQ